MGGLERNITIHDLQSSDNVKCWEDTCTTYKCVVLVCPFSQETQHQRQAYLSQQSPDFPQVPADACQVKRRLPFLVFLSGHTSQWLKHENKSHFLTFHMQTNMDISICPFHEYDSFF